MIERTLVCHSCQIDNPFSLRFEPCSHCGGPLDVQFDTLKAFKKFNYRELKTERGSIWRFWPFFPISDPGSAITLGEGGTPLLRHARLNEFLDLPNLLLKNESSNPTWSFKDRLNSINATLARESGKSEIVASSTGNHGASAAAYAAAGGMQSAILMPHGTPDVFSQMVAAYGGQPILTDWHGRYPLMEYLVNERGWFPSKSALPAPLSNPFGLEGYKSIAYELCINGGAPDYVVVPVGSGDDVAGIYKGFTEFYSLNLIERIPALIACEAEASAPISQAINNASNIVEKIVSPETIAVSISEGIAGVHSLRAVKESSGFAAVANESEILSAMHVMAQAGFVAESSSCVSIAALIRAVKENRIKKNSKIVVILTSSGIKWPAQLARLGCHAAASIRSDPKLLEGVLHQVPEIKRKIANGAS